MSRKKIFVLEDDPDIMELVTYILETAGYEVTECSTVGRFNELISQALPDIFILDILLPDGNGLDICKQLRTAHSTAEIPVLMMSANRTKQDIEAYGCPADFISKPFDIDLFIEKVDRFV